MFKGPCLSKLDGFFCPSDLVDSPVAKLRVAMPNYEDISEDDQIRLDAVCEEFGIELCREGIRPQIAEFVARVSDTLKQRLSDRLLSKYA